MTAPTATAPTQQAITDDEIDAAILNALEPTGGELVSWRAIRNKVPGDFWQQARAVTRLFESHAIYCIKIGGLNHLSLQHGANAPGPERRPRDLRVL